MATAINSNTGYVEEVSIAVVILSLAICIFGIIGNSVAVFIVVALKEYQKSITHWYILHLAIADSIFLLTLPFQVSSELNQKWIYPEWLCKAKETILFCNYYASILFLMVMSIDRYIAVCRSFSLLSKWLRKHDAAHIISIAVWAIALLLCIPIMLYSTTTGEYPDCKCTYEFPEPVKDICVSEGEPGSEAHTLCSSLLRLQEQENHCLPRDVSSEASADNNNLFDQFFREPENETENSSSASGSGEGNDDANVTDNTDGSVLNSYCHYEDQVSGFISFLYVNFGVMFVLPLLVMLVCYGLIIEKLSSTRVRTATPASAFTPSIGSKQSQKRKPSKSQTDRRRVTVMCASLVMCFVICWLPFHSIHLAKIVGIKDTESEICTSLFKFGTLLAYLNSALNPYLYSFLGTNFTKRWKTATISFRRSISRGRLSSTGSVASARHNQIRTWERKISNTGITKLSKAQEAKNAAFEAAPCMEQSKAVFGSSSSDSGDKTSN